MGLWTVFFIQPELFMATKVQKWGNSQGIRLPKNVLESARLEVGDSVAVEAHNGQIVITKVSKPKFNLAEMVAEMPKTYEVLEDSFGKPMGKEAW